MLSPENVGETGDSAAGETTLSVVDCLIAVPAIRAGAGLRHAHADFDEIPRHTRPRIHLASRAA